MTSRIIILQESIFFSHSVKGCNEFYIRSFSISKLLYSSPSWGQIKHVVGPVHLPLVGLYLCVELSKTQYVETTDVKITSMTRALSLLFSSFLFSSIRGSQQKLPSAEASKWAQCTSPGQYTPCITGIVKTP